MRILATIFFFVFVGAGHNALAQKNDAIGSAISTWEMGDRVNIDNNLDPIVTGQTLSPDDMADWERRKKRFLECGLCGEEQAFPGDLSN